MDLIYTKNYIDGTKQIFIPDRGSCCYQSLVEKIDVTHGSFIDSSLAFLLPPKEKKEQQASTEKNIADSRNRARKAVYDLAVSNNWDYFFTQTLSPDFMDRTDVDGAFEAIRKKIYALKRNYPEFKALIIAEYHKKTEENGLKALHFHGLISGLPESALGTGYKTKKGYAWEFPFLADLGWNGLSVVRESGAAARYLVKYITKGFVYRGKNKACYICSRGLARPEKRKYLLTPGAALKIHELHDFKEMFGMTKSKRYESQGGVSHVFFDCFVSDDDFVHLVDPTAQVVDVSPDRADDPHVRFILDSIPVLSTLSKSSYH
jgi:hypothetical protein